MSGVTSGGPCWNASESVLLFILPAAAANDSWSSACGFFSWFLEKEMGKCNACNYLHPYLVAKHAGFTKK